MNRTSRMRLSSAAVPTPLPSTIPTARQTFGDLERWLGSPFAGTLDLRAVEREQERRGRELLRRLLQDYLDHRGPGDVGPGLWAREAQGRTVGCTHKRLHTRRLISLFGPVYLRRMGYGGRGIPSIHPLDALLQMPARSYGYELQRRLLLGVVQGPFDEAIRNVAEFTQVRIPKRSAEQILQDASDGFDDFYRSRRTGPVAGEGPIVVGAIDCKGIPMVKTHSIARKVRLGKGEKRQKKRMATVAAVFTQSRRIRTPAEVVKSLFEEEKTTRSSAKLARPERKRVWASLLDGKDLVIQSAWTEMKHRDPDQQKEWVVVTDGERALQIRVCNLFPKAWIILDLLHVLEKLWMVSHTLHPEGSEQAREFVRQRIERILEGGVSQAVKGLRQTATKRKMRGVRAKIVTGVAKYLYRNRSRMRYDEYLKRGFPIASGTVEGACKNLIKDRMERSGMRWTELMGEAMLRMRAVYLSGDFEAYWDFHVDQEQSRLYRRNTWKSMEGVVLK